MHHPTTHLAPDRTIVIHSTPAPTTARTIARLTDSRRSTRELAPLGFALRHFTEPVLGHLEVDLVRIHRATAVLTKQIGAVIDDDHPVPALCMLIADPDRAVLPNGMTARELCGPAWTTVRSVALRRLDEVAGGAAEFGTVTVLRLAALHAADALSPWWGTAAWNLRVEEWLTRVPQSSLFRLALLRAPEHVDDEIVREVLQ